MRRKVMLKEVISTLKLSLFITWCWPLSQDATRLKGLCVKLYHCLCIILLIALGAPLTYAIINHLDKPAFLVQLIVMLCGTIHAICYFVFYRMNGQHIQNVTVKMEYFFNFMQLHEEIIIQRYIDKCSLFYGTSMLVFYISIAVTVIIPPIIHQPFPSLAEYPFDVHYQPLKSIIYIYQTITGFIIMAQLCTNSFVALLIWFTSARFEMLIEELRTITNVCQLFKCIKKHEELLKYAREVSVAARPFALISVSLCALGGIVALLLFVTIRSLYSLHLFTYEEKRKQPLPIIVQFSGFAVTGVSEVFMLIWPAEHLLSMSGDVAQAAFDILENNHIEMWKCLLLIIMRSQKPVGISIPSVMPTLSYNYFSSYLSTVFSYFVTLRVMIDNGNS